MANLLFNEGGVGHEGGRVSRTFRTSSMAMDAYEESFLAQKNRERTRKRLKKQTRRARFGKSLKGLFLGAGMTLCLLGAEPMNAYSFDLKELDNLGREEPAKHRMWKKRDSNANEAREWPEASGREPTDAERGFVDSLSVKKNTRFVSFNNKTGLARYEDIKGGPHQIFQPETVIRSKYDNLNWQRQIASYDPDSGELRTRTSMRNDKAFFERESNQVVEDYVSTNKQ